jgi:hypothetical protein
VPVVGTLVDVKRTRAVLRFADLPEYTFYDQLDKKPQPKAVFGETGEWIVPIEHLLLPGSVEPLPGQRELFEDNGGPG